VTKSNIYIDADACPVKDEIYHVAARYDLKTYVVSNGGLRPTRNPMIENVIVPQGPDIADDWIADKAGAGDIVITADIPLAKRCVENLAKVLGPKGKLFTSENIGMALAVREINQHVREASQTQTFNSAFSKQDRSNFLQALDRVVIAAINGK